MTYEESIKYFNDNKDRLLKDNNYHNNLINLLVNVKDTKKANKLHIASIAALLTDNKINFQQAKKLVEISVKWKENQDKLVNDLLEVV